MTTQQTPLGNFIIKRGPDIDWDYTNELIALEHRQALQEAAGQAIIATKQHVVNLAKTIGTGLLKAFDA